MKAPAVVIAADVFEVELNHPQRMCAVDGRNNLIFPGPSANFLNGEYLSDGTRNVRQCQHFGLAGFGVFHALKSFCCGVTQLNHFQHDAFGFGSIQPRGATTHVFMSGNYDFIAPLQGYGSAGQINPFAHIFGDGQFAAFASDDGGQLVFEAAIVHGVCGIFCQVSERFVQCFQYG